MNDVVAKGNPALIGREVTQAFTKEEEGWLYFLRCAPRPILTLLEKMKQKQGLPLWFLIHSANPQGSE